MDLFDKMKECVEFAEAANTPIPGGKALNIAHSLIVITGGKEKSCDWREEILVDQNTWQPFKNHLTQSYTGHHDGICTTSPSRCDLKTRIQ